MFSKKFQLKIDTNNAIKIFHTLLFLSAQAFDKVLKLLLNYPASERLRFFRSRFRFSFTPGCYFSSYNYTRG